jgi:MFS family permease
MKTIDNEQVEKLLEDIASIKEVINRNKPIIQQVFNLTNFRLLALLSGISVIVFSLLFYFLIIHYGEYSAIPVKFKWSIYFAISLITILVSIMKQRLYLRSLKKIDKSCTLCWMFKEIFSNQFVHIYLSSIFLSLFLTTFFIIKGIPYFIIATISIWIGLFYIAGAMLHIRHSLVMGYWFFLTGIGILIFNTIPASLAVLITFGAGFLILAMLGYIDQESRKAE